MNSNSIPNYAALIKASEEHLHPPDWLAIGKSIYSTKHGLGEVVGIIGNQLVANFRRENQPISLNWVSAIASQELIPASESPQPLLGAGFEEIGLGLAETIAYTETIPPIDGTLHPIPDDLPIALSNSLKAVGIEQIYSHQLESLQAIRQGKDICILTPTASGKTWCFNIPILESCLTSNATALYLYPLKALAADQIGKLRSLVALLPSNATVKVGIMTGDVSMLERKRLFVSEPPQILGVSPDLLHYQLYAVRAKDGEGFRAFLRRLRYVVVDESHTYQAGFAANFANLMRRLRLAVDTVGGNSSRLQWVFSSATIGNPSQMALRFSGREATPERLQLIDKNGAKNAGRTIVCLKPSSTANPDAAKVILYLLQQELSGICFCNNRSAVKNLLSLIKQEAMRQGCPHLAEAVAIFYGSLKNERRHEIIEQVKAGRIKAILSTSSLEAGIDLPSLDWCLVRGWPGSLMSFRQRIGRAGRGNNPGLVIFLPVATNPLDNYYSTNPHLLLHGAAESSEFNSNYPVLLGKHLLAAAVESGIPLHRLNDYFGEKAGAIASALMSQNQLYVSRNRQLWGRGYPHKDINLRGQAAATIKLIDGSTGEEFEETNLDIAYREVFPGAIYSSQSSDGQIVKYKSRELNVEQRRAILIPIEPNSPTFTIAESEQEVKLIEALAEPKTVRLSLPNGELKLTLGWGEIKTLVRGYRLCVKQYELTCTRNGCKYYHQPLSGKFCPGCGTKLKRIELVTVVDEVTFDEPYCSQYKAPMVQVTINAAGASIMAREVQHLQSKIQRELPEVPAAYAPLWTASPTRIALHSIGHQIIFAVPLVILSSSLDLNYLVTESTETIGYFYDAVADGNGCSEAVFHQLEKFAQSAASLARNCNCEAGCPRCLYLHSCPQDNDSLNKQIGLKLLEAMF
ncbi:MAG: DEAD/DEAH box helicase (plasmid) [Phormidium sp.]